MNTLKPVIREVAEAQAGLKNQRKTVHIVGNRMLPADEAANKHRNNREALRQYYIAYAILRGKDPLKAVASYQGPNSWEGRQVAKLVDQYSPDFSHEVVRADQ